MNFWSGLRAILALGALGTTTFAQSVVLNLPPDGTWIRFEGTFTQTEERPGTALGKLEIPPWIEHVTIKSVGTTMAEYRGETVPCRWLEFKVERGREADGKIVVGKTGLEIYKVLVPEPEITANPVVEEGIPIGYVPFVRGVRVLGEGEPEPLTEPALKLYPLAMLFNYCRDLKVEEMDVDPGTGLGALSTNLLTGTLTLERRDSKSETSVKVWASPDVPFGVAAWSARTTRWVKDAQAPRDSFQLLTQVDVELKAQGTGQDAMSEVDFQ